MTKINVILTLGVAEIREAIRQYVRKALPSLQTAKLEVRPVMDAKLTSGTGVIEKGPVRAYVYGKVEA